MKGPKCHNFGRLGISCFKKEGFGKLTQTLKSVSSTFLHPTELIRGSPYARGLTYHHLPFMGPIRLTNYNLHAHVQYCITIHYNSCSIDKHRNVDGPKCCTFGSYIWILVNQTYVSTILGHQIPLPGGTSDWRSAWPKGWPNVKLTWCSTALGH